jgi:Helix-turn-helix domain
LRNHAVFANLVYVVLPSTPSARLTADDVMTAREVAGLLHSPVSTVEDRARRGLLPSVKVGRRLYIRRHVEDVLLAGPRARAAN